MAIFGNSAVGVDLGSFHTAVYLPDKGLCLREETRCLVNADNPQEALAVGSKARAMQGKTGTDAVTMAPVMAGAVADIEMTALLIMALIEKAAGKKKNLEKSLLCVSASAGLTRVERDALHRALASTGARRMAVVKSPVAALLGAEVDVSAVKGVMSVILGGGTTEISVVSLGAVVANRTIRMGGDSADEDIIHWFRREKDVIIGEKTAEQLKRDLGAAAVGECDDSEPILLRGRSAFTGEPCTVEITPADVHTALQLYVGRILDAMRSTLGKVPPELAGDIRENGIHLSGGGALMPGLAQAISDATGVAVHVSPHPMDDVALGVGGAATDDELRDALAFAGSLDDIG